MDTRVFEKIEEPKNTEEKKPISAQTAAEEPTAKASLTDENLPVPPTAQQAHALSAEKYESDEEEKPAKKNKKKKNDGGPSKLVCSVYDWASALLTALVILVVIMTYCVRQVDVDGSSMMDTLQDNDRVLIAGLNYEPEVGDIVVISHGAELNKTIIKRVIAVGGQTVDIDFETGEVMVDGVVLDEPYILGSTTVSADVEFPLTVEEGTVFVLGDNRVISKDSRYSEVGLIEEESIIGKVVLRIYPFSSFGTVE